MLSCNHGSTQTRFAEDSLRPANNFVLLIHVARMLYVNTMFSNFVLHQIRARFALITSIMDVADTVQTIFHEDTRRDSCSFVIVAT